VELVPQTGPAGVGCVTSDNLALGDAGANSRSQQQRRDAGDGGPSEDDDGDSGHERNQCHRR